MPKQRKPAAPPAQTDSVAIDALLSGLGFDTAAAKKRARAVLETAGLTNPRKQAISIEKQQRAEEAIADALVRVCGDACAALARDASGAGRRPVVVSGVTCEVCGGSNNRRAAIACARVLRAKGIERVLVVGGSPGTRHQLDELLSAGGLTLEMVDGTVKHSHKEALQRMNRAEVLVIWGSTELNHAVSELYTQEPPAGLRVIKIGRRGVEALCDELRASFATGGRR